MSLREIVREANFDHYFPFPPGALPFAQNGGGDFVLVDVNGALGKGRGAVAHAFHDEEARIVVAPSLLAFLNRAADSLARASLDDEGCVTLPADD
jgi:cell wall assembly regulator SMI1